MIRGHPQLGIIWESPVNNVFMWSSRDWKRSVQASDHVFMLYSCDQCKLANGIPAGYWRHIVFEYTLSFSRDSRPRSILCSKYAGNCKSFGYWDKFRFYVWILGQLRIIFNNFQFLCIISWKVWIFNRQGIDRQSIYHISQRLGIKMLWDIGTDSAYRDITEHWDTCLSMLMHRWWVFSSP